MSNGGSACGQRAHGPLHLAEGLVMDPIVECPKRNGRFDDTTGRARGAPVCVSLQTHVVKVEDGIVLVDAG